MCEYVCVCVCVCVYFCVCVRMYDILYGRILHHMNKVEHGYHTYQQAHREKRQAQAPHSFSPVGSDRIQIIIRNIILDASPNIQCGGTDIAFLRH